MTTADSGISPATDWAGQAGLARAWHRQDGASRKLVDEARELADSAGLPDRAPYDRIIVTTGTWDLVTQWGTQLGPAGRIVLPLSSRGYGPSGPGFAKYLARQAIVWHELGRPGAQDLELSAWPSGARPETIGGASIVIDRPHVRLAVRWPTL